MGKILNKYPFGSRVYGTHTEDSDYDYIVVVDEYFNSNDTNTHVFTPASFQVALDNHDIAALEAYFLPRENKIKHTVSFNFILDKFKLRRSISTIASNSYVKGKKKLTVTGDYDKKAGIKSVFHSLRILDFATQIAVHGKIEDYSSSNWIWEDILEMTKDLDGIAAWKVIDDKYKSVYNTRASKFKELCPKLNHNTLNDVLTKLVKKYDVKEVGKMVGELEHLFNTYDTNKGITLDDVVSEALNDAVKTEQPDYGVLFTCNCFNSGTNCFSGMCDRCGNPKRKK